MRSISLLAVLAMASAAGAQNKPAANAPVAGAAAANTPRAASNAPAASPPAASPPAAAPAEKTVTIRVPSGGSFSAYVQEVPTAIKSIQDKGELTVPASGGFTVYVLDSQSGYAARKTVAAGAPAAELSFAGPDFKLVQKVRVEATGKDGKPIAQGVVSLTDGGKNTSRKVIQAASQGLAEFDFVVSGPGTVTVVPEGGSATTKEVTLDLRRGETVQTIPVAMPEVTAVVEPPAAAGPTTAPEGGAPPATTAPQGGAAAPTAAPTAAPAPAAPAPVAPQPAPADNIGQTLIGFLFLAALLAGAYYFMKSRGITVDMLLKKLGVQPDTVVQGGGSLAGANLASGPVAPGAPPPPPPVVADPNQCAFCGQMKDAAGNCACTVAPGAGGGAAAFGGPAAGAGDGPRLVGMAGTYMGHVFPLHGSVVMGRDASNPVALDRDTTASRRHAQISTDGGYRIQDLGSSNGTYVNGARVTEAPLQPGDEISIGGTRFRFEV